MMVSVELDDSEDADADWEIIDPRHDAPRTPSTTSDEAPPRPSFGGESSVADSDEEAAAEAVAGSYGELVPRRKPGGYDSRVEQMLYENPELPILITEAGKSTEGGGRHIVYTIKTGVRLCLEVDTTSFADHPTSRTSQFVGGIRNLPRFVMPSLDFTPRSSFPRYPKSIPWQIMRRTRQMRSRTSKS